jgi:hypothetical protein
MALELHLKIRISACGIAKDISLIEEILELAGKQG